MSRSGAPEHCAVCGAAVPPKALACPACGADERTGWREPGVYDGLDLPDAEPAPGPSRAGAALFWKITGCSLLFIVVVLVLLNRFWIIR